jgi:hypothetical protein
LRKTKRGSAAIRQFKNADNALESLNTIRMENSGYHQSSDGNPVGYSDKLPHFDQQVNAAPSRYLIRAPSSPQGHRHYHPYGRAQRRFTGLLYNTLSRPVYLSRAREIK